MRSLLGLEMDSFPFHSLSKKGEVKPSKCIKERFHKENCGY